VQLRNDSLMLSGMKANISRENEPSGVLSLLLMLGL